MKLEKTVNERNSFALTGFILSCASVPFWTAALLCLLGVMLNDVCGVTFLSVSALIAVTGIVFASIGHKRAVDTGTGMGFALAGLTCGTALTALCAAMAALIIVCVCIA